MIGYILGYDEKEQKGAISSLSDKRFSFELKEWRENFLPNRGVRGDFIPNEDRAKEIYLAKKSQLAIDNHLLFGAIAIIATFTFGFLGTFFSRLVFAKQSFSKIIVPVLLHAASAFFLFIPLFGWSIYLIITIYFAYTNFILSSAKEENESSF